MAGWVTPPMKGVTTQPVTAEPPSVAGADQPRVTWPVPPATESPVGIPGRVAAVTAADGVVDGTMTGIACGGDVGGGVGVPAEVTGGVVVVLGIGPGVTEVVVVADPSVASVGEWTIDVREPPWAMGTGAAEAADATGPVWGPACASPTAVATVMPEATRTPATK